MAPSEKTTRTAQAHAARGENTGSRGEGNFASDAAVGDARTLGIQADVTLVRQCVAGMWRLGSIWFRNIRGFLRQRWARC